MSSLYCGRKPQHPEKKPMQREGERANVQKVEIEITCARVVLWLQTNYQFNRDVDISWFQDANMDNFASLLLS